jgi:ADP-ribose pyrophosphatase YjhB (NUDIX family)
MFVATNGIVVDQFGQVLLIKRDDTRTWAIPGGALEAGELPPDGAAREVAEETGLKVEPVRLVGLDFWVNRSREYLVFTFRCLKSGGKITPSEESPQVGFMPVNPLPRSMLSLHRERLARGLVHDGGPPYWGRQELGTWLPLMLRTVAPIVYRWKGLRRRLKGQPRYQSPPPWHLGAFTVIGDEDNKVLWVKRTDYDIWNLPGGRSEPGEAPWETAVRETREETGLEIRLTGLSGVYIKTADNSMVFCFTAEVVGGALTTGPEAAAFATFAPGEEPANTLPKHLPRVMDAVAQQDTPFFRVQDGPPGLEVLGFK